MMNYGGIPMGWGIVCMVVVVATIALIVWAVMRRGNVAGVQGDALEMLECRFAKGEIDVSEYQRRRQLLMQH